MATHNPLPPSVNYHLWQPCNMRCRGCFARFEDVRADVLPRGHLPRDASLALASTLGRRFSKVTFAGGEPTLAPWLPDLISAAKQAGTTTMLVTNASRLDGSYLARLSGSLDWLTMSIDSSIPDVQAALGRTTRKGPIPSERYVELAHNARAVGIRVKVNTVVGTLNAAEDMSKFIRALAPERWKVLQVLPVAGQNDGEVEPLLIDAAAFAGFVARHACLDAEGIPVVPEDNEAMTGSYAMIDPAGRFFDNTAGRHTYSRPILDVGLDKAWADIRFHLDRFSDRGGVYRW